MNSVPIPVVIAMVIQFGLALAVFQSNPRRKSNQCFLVLSGAICLWLGSMGYAFNAHGQSAAELSIRLASAAGALVLTSFTFLRLAITRRQDTWPEIFRRSQLWLVATGAIVILCQTKFFLLGTHLSGSSGSAPIPDYGPGGYAYAAFFAVATIFLFVDVVRNLRTTTGAERAELLFTIPIGILTAGVSVLIVQLLRPWMPYSQLLWFTPFRAVLFSLVVAYGIATRKIMEVGILLRRLISYILLAAYLLGVYALVWWLIVTVLHSVQNAHSIAHVTAAVVIAIAMAPARGVSRRFAERLFITAHTLDFRVTVSKAAKILSSVTTLRDLLDRFAHTVAEAVGTDRVFILLSDKYGFSQQYPVSEPGSHQHLELTREQATIEQLQSDREPIVLDELHRVRPTPLLQSVIRQLDSLQIALAMGIFARDQLVGVMLLGARKSGRIYGVVEQSALQVLSGQLAVAIENAELFTEVQNAKIYNETLLENLTSGVIAVGMDERVTVFNNEAGEITGLNSQEMLDRTLNDLPEPLREPLRKTLATGESLVNSELVLHLGDGDVAVRASTSIFYGQDREGLGALIVLTDITSLKRLELQIRRSDRLASLGTLSAGMAHEIKNPLVSIKTFTQLLPERYQDAEFRETFSTLIGHEIDRIDSLVNQLLRFARPAKPILKPMHVHEILDKSLALVGHRLHQKSINLTRFLDANVDTIRADPDQLEQVFLNFFINAMDAMKNGGELSLRTEIGTDEPWASALNDSNGQAGEVLRITIRDTGEGIRTEDIPHVFDPFFTTKDYGTGLGLSVVHGIVQEHGGQIEVESVPQKGTAFHILLPLVRFDREVAAA
ncbi:MAG: ATP-binding protein [Verrucomicrobiota bacterium]